jgi:hypothetical protein
MLKYFLIVSMFLLIAPATFARTNAEIKQQLYKTANIIQKETPIHGLRQKENIDSFILELEMLNFNESSAIWKVLSTNYVYDEKSLRKYHLRYIGVYKSKDNSMMGIFDLNCEDFNDVQERTYGYTTTKDVYFTHSYKMRDGYSKGFDKKFCKNKNN